MGAQNSLATHAVALRHTRIASADIETWPTDLLEAWPVLQCLCSTPDTAAVGLYIDNASVISKWNRFVLSTDVTDLQWANQTDTWLWRYLLRPLHKRRVEAGGALLLQKIISHADAKGKTQSRALNILSDTADYWANGS